MSHTCHALRCDTPVPPKMFMCRRHWFMVPREMRSRIWDAYRPGQEIDKRPSREYRDVTHEAQLYVRDKEANS